jgi:hypothetical protein
MTAYLAYSYSTRLTEKEQAAIDERVKKSQKDFRKGASFALAMYFVYSLTIPTAHAVDSYSAPGPPDGGAGAIQPASAKPGFKPVSESVKGTFVGGATAISRAALQSGDFYMGFACAILLVIGGVIVNRS